VSSKLNTTVVAGIAVLFLGVAAYVTLVLTGHETATDKLLTFLGPSVAALVIVGHQQRQGEETKAKLEDTAEKLDVITKQTNGVLDARIANGTTAALERYDIAGDVRTALASMLETHLTDRDDPARHAAPTPPA
jgi:hypothetical protein